MSKPPKLSVRVPQKLLAGVYANQMVIRHTREEFILDFLNRFPPESVVTARVIVSPGHLKRMIGALQENLRRFEAAHGAVVRAGSPQTDAPPAEEGAPAAPPETPPADAPAAEPPAARTAKVPEELAPGVYANQMVVSHSRDEFLLDFASVFPPDGVVTARVFVSPDQLKRVIAALQENFGRYEAAHGAIVAAHLPQLDGYLN